MFLGNVFGLTTDLAIDLGTANTCVFVPGRGIVLNEPSVVAFNTEHNRIEAVGAKAREMIGRTPQNMVADPPAAGRGHRRLRRRRADAQRLHPPLASPHRLGPSPGGHRRAGRNHAGRAPRRERQHAAGEGERGLPDRRAGRGGDWRGPAHHRADRQHDRGHRRRHHRHRRDLAGRPRVPPVGARRRRRDGRWRSSIT